MDKIRKILPGCVLVLLGILTFLYFADLKEVWFCDEIYSYESANGVEQSWPAQTIGEWMSGGDIESFLAADWDEFRLQYIMDVIYGDHVPLYFFVFRILGVLFFHGSASIWIGLSINLVFYLILLVLGYVFSYKLTGNSKAALVLMLITSVVNRFMISQMTMLRMYMMLLCAEVLLILGALWILREVKGKMRFLPFIYLYIISIFGFLIHYDYWIFYAVTATVFCCWLLFKAWKERGKKFFATRTFGYVLAWGGNFVASLLTTILIFPYCRWNLNKGKGQTALYSIIVFSKEKWENILWGYERLAKGVFGNGMPTVLGLGILFGCILGGGWLLVKRKEFAKATGLFLTMAVTQAYQVVVCFTLPAEREERYLWGSSSIFFFCVCYGAFVLVRSVLPLVKKVWIRSVAVIVLVVGIVLGEWLVLDNGYNVPYLFHPDKDVEVLEEHGEVPWVVYGPTLGVYSYYDWLIPEKICFFSLEEGAKEVSAAKELEGEACFVVYTYPDYIGQAEAFFEQCLGVELSNRYLTHSTNLGVFLLEVEKK